MKKLFVVLSAVVVGGLFLSVQAAKKSNTEDAIQASMAKESFYLETVARPEIIADSFFLETVARVDVEPGIVVVLETAPRDEVRVSSAK